MARLLIDQEFQIAPSDVYEDTRAPGASLETGSLSARDDLNALRSQLKRIIHGLDVGNWYDDPAAIFGANASLKALLAALNVSYRIASLPGQFAVPAAVSVRDLVYTTGAFSADIADNHSVAKTPVIGMVIEKPSTTSATIAYFGMVEGFSGLVPGSDLFLGMSGGIITPPLPSTPGRIIQKIGQALSPAALLLDPDPPIAL